MSKPFDPLDVCVIRHIPTSGHNEALAAYYVVETTTAYYVFADGMVRVDDVIAMWVQDDDRMVHVQLRGLDADICFIPLPAQESK